MNAPRLFPQYDADDDLWRIMVATHGLSPMPAGPRLFRAPPHPDVKWAHASKAEADAAISVIQKYLARSSAAPSKRELRESAA